MHYKTIIHNSSWLLGDGCRISFWNDMWYGQPISSGLLETSSDSKTT